MYKLNFKVSAYVDWQQLAKTRDEQINRIQTENIVQSAANKLQPIFSQMLITFIEANLEARNSMLTKPILEVQAKPANVILDPYININPGLLKTPVFTDESDN